MARYEGTEQLAGESQDDHIKRLESSIHGLESDLRRTETERDAARQERDDAQSDAKRVRVRLEWLAAQLADLAIQIASPSAPTRKSEMALLINGLLDEEDWRNGAWKRPRKQKQPPGQGSVTTETASVTVDNETRTELAMGQKADTLNQELVPTRSLLRWLADQVGVTIEEDITSVAEQARYQGLLERALASRSPAMPLREDPPRAVDDIDAGGGALVPRPADSTTDDVDIVDRIARLVGVTVEGTRRDRLECLHEALERIMGGGGDVEVPTGESLAQAMQFGHDQNHALRERLRTAEMLIQRIAGSLQVTLLNGDGSPVLDAVQRLESTKLLMRRRILELRGVKLADAQLVAAAQAADELELQYTRLLSPAEEAEWHRVKGRTSHLSEPRLEHAPHPFRFTFEDLGRLASCAQSASMSPSIGSQEMSRRAALGNLIDEIRSSPNGTAHVLACMETTLAVLARERASKIKE